MTCISLRCLTQPDISKKEASKKWLQKRVSNDHIFKSLSFLTPFHNVKTFGIINTKKFDIMKKYQKSLRIKDMAINEKSPVWRVTQHCVPLTIWCILSTMIKSLYWDLIFLYLKVTQVTMSHFIYSFSISWNTSGVILK